MSHAGVPLRARSYCPGRFARNGWAARSDSFPEALRRRNRRDPDIGQKGRPVNTRLLRTKVALVVATATVIGTAGVALAALPGAANQAATAALAKHSVTVPGPNAHAGTHPDGSGGSADTSSAPTTDTGSNKGSVISQLAHSTTATGVAKGAAICTVASNGKCQAGQHGKAGESHGKSGDPHGKPSGSGDAAPVTTPNHGGTGTADTAARDTARRAPPRRTPPAADVVRQDRAMPEGITRSIRAAHTSRTPRPEPSWRSRGTGRCWSSVLEASGLQDSRCEGAEPGPPCSSPPHHPG
jgi:hypothetical protein